MAVKKDEQKGTCRLCKNEDVRLCFSHILSEFLYEDYYKERHRFIALTSDPHDNRSPVRQKGIREVLLCEKCETKISVWENYAKKLLSIVKCKAPIKGIIHIRKVDYKQFKLFLMSILWRMSVSKIPEFSCVKLDKERERKLETWLLNENPGNSSGFICVIRRLTHDNHNYDSEELMIPSLSRSTADVNEFRTVINGFVFDFITTDSPISKEIYIPSLTTSGDFRIETVGDQFVIDYLKIAALHAIRNNPKIADMWERDTDSSN